MTHSIKFLYLFSFSYSVCPFPPTSSRLSSHYATSYLSSCIFLLYLIFFYIILFLSMHFWRGNERKIYNSQHTQNTPLKNLTFTCFAVISSRGKIMIELLLIYHRMSRHKSTEEKLLAEFMNPTFFFCSFISIVITTVYF